ncbi:hypothetical protein JW921_11365 [Candidatus Fermentibacterales bacterium]|nr:hypothetical protein [Candidatus Fermentibacterales bacterium]
MMKQRDSTFESLLDRVATDMLHGASELYMQVLEGMVSAERLPEDLPDRLLEIARDMAPLIYLSMRLRESDDWSSVASGLLDARGSDLALIAEAMLSFLPRQAQVFCHSRSGTVLSVLERISGSIDRVFQTVSEPGGEGREAHNILRSAGINVWLVNDNAYTDIPVSRAIPVMGADAVTTDYFINKVGSQRIVEAALDAEVPVYVVAAREKLIDPALYQGRPRDTTLFERVPISEGVILVTPGMKDDQPRR